MSFWKDLKKPIIGLSPMDGVTDAAFRYMVAKYSRPDVIITEFTNVEGLARSIMKLLPDFLYSSLERPIVAQVFGSTPEAFYKVAFIVCDMGFDGIDINMGCPDNDVTKRGGGGALIKNPDLAKKIIRSTFQGIKDWSEGKKIESLDFSSELLTFIKNFTCENNSIVKRKMIPISIKTRIGFDKNIISEWVQNLLETPIENISIHGRTLKQMYGGVADWDAIAQAAAIIKKANVTVLGNGDVKTLQDAHEKIEKYGVDGVLVGRATFGFPSFFIKEKRVEPTLDDLLKMAKEHAVYYERVLPDRPFVALRKHMAWYIKNVHGAAHIRHELVRISSMNDLDEIIKKYTK